MLEELWVLLGTKNLTDEVIIAKMLISGTSLTISSLFYGKSFGEAFCDGLLSTTFSCGISTVSLYASSFLPNTNPTIDDIYAKQFLYSFVSFFSKPIDI